MNSSKKPSMQDYYKAGMQLMFSQGETFDNYKQILSEYENALIIRQDRINALYNEIKIIKKLKL